MSKQNDLLFVWGYGQTPNPVFIQLGTKVHRPNCVGPKCKCFIFHFRFQIGDVNVYLGTAKVTYFILFTQTDTGKSVQIYLKAGYIKNDTVTTWE